VFPHTSQFSCSYYTSTFKDHAKDSRTLFFVGYSDQAPSENGEIKMHYLPECHLPRKYAPPHLIPK
jgi:hypothetical protein